MGLSLRVLFIVSGVLIILIASVAMLSSQMLLNGFETVEIERTESSIEQLREAYNVELENLKTKLADWAMWDDSYTFINDNNPEFIKSNLQPASFEIIKINFIIYVNNNKEIVYAGYLDPNGTVTPLPENIRAIFTGDSRLLQPTQLDESIAEMVSLPDSPVIVASRPIFPSVVDFSHMSDMCRCYCACPT